jgi:hypothetical protein
LLTPPNAVMEESSTCVSVRDPYHDNDADDHPHATKRQQSFV